jgi:RNA polymerase sigma-70 factor (ECF subfamily)
MQVAIAYVSSRAVAEEVVQDTWLGVLEGLSMFEGRSSLRGWIFRILTNRASTRAHRERRSTPFSALGREDEADAGPAVEPSRFHANGRWSSPPGAWEETTPEELVSRHEAMVEVEKALERLPPAQRVVLVMRDVEGLDSPEVCELLQISEGNQRVLLHRARSRIRQVLEDEVGGRP